MKLYDVICDHTDGSRAAMEGLSLSDVLAMVRGLDNLSIIECSISPAEGQDPSTYGKD